MLGIDILTPQDLESTFGLTGGNIFHGAMGLDQLFIGRPVPGHSNYRTPIKGTVRINCGQYFDIIFAYRSVFVRIWSSSWWWGNGCTRYALC